MFAGVNGAGKSTLYWNEIEKGARLGQIAMLSILKNEGVSIEESFHKKALEMVLSEIKGSKAKGAQDCQFGLGMNGFYMMFRTASVCKKINER